MISGIRAVSAGLAAIGKTQMEAGITVINGRGIGGLPQISGGKAKGICTKCLTRHKMDLGKLAAEVVTGIMPAR